VRGAPAPPAAVVFDNDGLLLDTERAWTRAERRQFARYGVEFTLAHKHQLVGASGAVAEARMEQMLDLPGHGSRLMLELHELVWAEIDQGAPPMPGAAELVAALRERGTPVGLATNSTRAFVEKALAKSGLAGSFDIVVAADEVAHPKPAPDLYLTACAGLGADPADAVALEDSPTGAAAARAAGMFVIGIPSLDGIVLEADLVAPSLAAPEVHDVLGL
jgi:HAD superfamily hydrolase (TIGR01509 family)